MNIRQRKNAILREMKALKREYSRVSQMEKRRVRNIRENYSGAYSDSFNLNFKNVDALVNTLIDFYKTKAQHDVIRYELASSTREVLNIASDVARSISKDVKEIVRIRGIDDEKEYINFESLADHYITGLFRGKLDDYIIEHIDGVMDKYDRY